MSDMDELFCQRNPIWAAQHLGLPAAARGSTIGAYGCAISAIARKLELMGFPTTPPDVQAALLAHDGFRHDETLNLVNWPRVPDAYPQLVFRGRDDGSYINQPLTSFVLKQITGRLLMDDYVILYVDASAYERGLQQHFVLATGVSADGQIMIDNPWNGKHQDLRPYGKTDAIAICGFVFLDMNLNARRRDERPLGD